MHRTGSSALRARSHDWHYCLRRKPSLLYVQVCLFSWDQKASYNTIIAKMDDWVKSVTSKSRAYGSSKGCN